MSFPPKYDHTHLIRADAFFLRRPRVYPHVVLIPDGEPTGVPYTQGLIHFGQFRCSLPLVSCSNERRCWMCCYCCCCNPTTSTLSYHTNTLCNSYRVFCLCSSLLMVVYAFTQHSSSSDSSNASDPARATSPNTPVALIL